MHKQTAFRQENTCILNITQAFCIIRFTFYHHLECCNRDKMVSITEQYFGVFALFLNKQCKSPSCVCVSVFVCEYVCIFRCLHRKYHLPFVLAFYLVLEIAKYLENESTWNRKRRTQLFEIFFFWLLLLVCVWHTNIIFLDSWLMRSCLAWQKTNRETIMDYNEMRKVGYRTRISRNGDGDNTCWWLRG